VSILNSRALIWIDRGPTGIVANEHETGLSITLKAVCNGTCRLWSEVSGGSVEVSNMETTEEERILFRVVELDQPRFLRGPKIVLNFDRINMSGMHYGVKKETLAPYLETIEEAIASGAEYWVDLDYSMTPTFPMALNDSQLDRILNAIKNRQIASPE
jgi:hypothetical protein